MPTHAHTHTNAHTHPHAHTPTDTASTDRVTLYYREGRSDKVYQCSIEPKDGGFVVRFAFGRRGSTLQTGTKTNAPVYYDAARLIFDKLVQSKLAKGYTPGHDGTPYHHTTQQAQSTGILPQLLNPIDEAHVSTLISDPAWCMQEKKDGRRVLLHKHHGSINGINRKGLAIELPSSIISSAERLVGDFLIDGECVGDVLYAFDLLTLEAASLIARPYQQRLTILAGLLDALEQGHIDLAETAFDATEKTALLETLRREQREGVVFKRLDAPYTPGRPASGGTQLKYKFYATLAAVVHKINTQRSVQLQLFGGRSWVSVGNVTIPPRQPLPAPGAIIEVRYLYAFAQSNALYQPTYLGLRHDLAPLECTLAQLKYKSISDEEES